MSLIKFTLVHAEPKSQPETKNGAKGQMEAFNQIPATGLMWSALSMISWCIVAVLLMTNHTLRDAEGQNHFFPLTSVPEIRPQIKLVQIQSVFWSLSEKRTISPRDFFSTYVGQNVLYSGSDFAPYPSCRSFCLKDIIHNCPRTGDPRAWAHFTPANIRSSVITDQICIGEEEDVGPMLLYLRHLCSSRKFLWLDFSFFFLPGELQPIVCLISSDLDLCVKMKAI